MKSPSNSKRSVKAVDVVKSVEYAIDNMQRYQFKDGGGHEYIDTCDIYKFIQRYRRWLIAPTPRRSGKKKV